MKFSCEKNDLVNAVTIASRAAATKSAVPSMEGLLIEAGTDLTIWGYNQKTGIRSTITADVTEPGAIVINARLFGDIIRKLPEDVIYVSVNEKLMVHIRCSMSEYNISGLSADEYPELPATDYQNSIYMQEKDIKSMIAETNFAVMDNEARPIYTGALFEVDNDILTVVAVDGFRLALRRERVAKTEVGKISFVVPGAALTEVERIAGESDELVKITLGSSHVMFTLGSNLLIARRLEGEFMNYRNSIPQTGKYSIGANRRDVIDTVERVSLIISDKFKSPVRCEFSDGKLRVSTATTLGKASDECAVDGDGEGLEIGFNNRYILDALKAAPADNIRFQLSTSVSPCVITPAEGEKNFLYMILPVRLRTNEG